MPNKNISIFYHLYIPDTSGMWIWWVDEQLGLLFSSGLHINTKVNVCITMPLYLEANIKGNTIHYHETVIDYINKRYPFVDIINVRDINDTNIFEGQTLKCLYDYSIKNDGYVMYFHSKDITGNVFDSTGFVSEGKNWRQYMQHYCISNWRDCIKKLEEGYDCVGVNYFKDFYPFAGNFWWSTTNHIKRLDDPLDVEKYFTQPNYRYAFELWIGSKKDYIDIKHYYLDSKEWTINEYANQLKKFS